MRLLSDYEMAEIKNGLISPSSVTFNMTSFANGDRQEVLEAARDERDQEKCLHLRIEQIENALCIEMYDHANEEQVIQYLGVEKLAGWNDIGPKIREALEHGVALCRRFTLPQRRIQPAMILTQDGLKLNK